MGKISTLCSWPSYPDKQSGSGCLTSLDVDASDFGLLVGCLDELLAEAACLLAICMICFSLALSTTISSSNTFLKNHVFTRLV